MPALSADLPPQLGTGNAPVAEHDDGHVPGDCRRQFPEQFHGGVHPGAALGGLVDAPGHRDGATAVEHADDDGRGLVAFERGVNGQGQASGTPPGENPPQQGREAESYVQLSLAGAGPVAAVVEPLPQILPQTVPSTPGREGRGHGVLAGAAGENSPADPQDQAGQLWLGEVRSMRFDRLLHLIAFSGKAHRGSPASGRVTTKMPDAGAPSQATRKPNFRLYIPLSVVSPGRLAVEAVVHR